jgi:HPr kinase/phosphorylase
MRRAGPPGGDATDVAAHATCVVVGEAGVLIRGASGAGKSTLARKLLAGAARAGLYGSLVADDRVRLSVRGGRVLAKTPASIAGKMEMRGQGILTGPHESAAVLRLVVDCGVKALDRFPERVDLLAEVAGVCLPRIVAGPEDADRVLLALGYGQYLYEPGNPSPVDAL